jgi:DNA-binding NtrC family response regulator
MTLMPSECFVWTRDAAFLSSFSDFWTDRGGPPWESFSNRTELWQRLTAATQPTLILDTRLSACDADTVALCEQILRPDSPLRALQLVTVGTEAWPRPLAATMAMLTKVHLTVTPDGVIERPAEGRLETLWLTRRATPLPLGRAVTAGDVTLLTYCPQYAETIDELLRVAHRDVTLLLIGETGTGKTTLARFIHHRSPRGDRGFQHLACGALPNDLIESELFGHTRGAFTGAERNKLGRFQAAGRGTLLLDEIDVLDLRQQVKLLRVIESGEYELVGSTETRVSEARLIVASNVELEAMAERGDFRSDLYYRLNVLEFRLPALRDRPMDIIPLALRFIDESCREHGIVIETIDREFLEALEQYRWPGNLRELKNHMRRAVLFADQRRLTRRDLSPKLLEALATRPPGDSSRPSAAPLTIAEQVARSERELLQQALAAHGHNRTHTAAALGLSRVGLYKKLKRLGLITTAE